MAVLLVEPRRAEGRVVHQPRQLDGKFADQVRQPDALAQPLIVVSAQIRLLRIEKYRRFEREPVELLHRKGRQEVVYRKHLRRAKRGAFLMDQGGGE